MAMVEQGDSRRVAIVDAISRELQRQGVPMLDIEALAAAVEEALTQQAPAAEGKRPEDLNATNDD